MDNYRHMLMNAPIGYARFEDPTREVSGSDDFSRYIVAELNPSFERFFRISAGDVLGKPASEVFDEEMSRTLDWTVFCTEVACADPEETAARYYSQYDSWFKIYGTVPALGEIAVFVTDITEEVRAERLEPKRQVEQMLDVSRIGTWEWNVQTGECRFNRYWAEIAGYTLEELEPLSIRTWIDLVHPEDLDRSNTLLEKHFTGELDSYRAECRMHHKSGDWIWVLDHGKVVEWDEKGKPLVMIGTHTDVTELKQAEYSLRESRELLELFFKQSLDGFFFMMLDEPVVWNDEIDKDSVLEYVLHHQRITKINRAMLEQYRAEEKDFIGRTPADFFAHDPAEGKRVWRRFLDEGLLHIDTKEKRFDGTDLIIEGDYICIYDREGRITGHFGIQRDVTFEREARQTLERISILDPLTDMYNRRYIFERLELADLKRKRDGSGFAVALLDIDHFKVFNDTYGHRAGDEVLKSFARILVSRIRPYDLAGRYGGEEFILVFADTGKEEAARVVERILDTVRGYVLDFDGKELSFTFSGGVASSEDEPRDSSVEELIEAADARLYEAKRAGRNRIMR